jgi:hypothetical protein
LYLFFGGTDLLSWASGASGNIFAIVQTAMDQISTGPFRNFNLSSIFSHMSDSKDGARRSHETVSSREGKSSGR